MTKTESKLVRKMKYDEVKLGEEVKPSLVPLLGAALIFPASVLFWVFNYWVSVITSSVQIDEIDGNLQFLRFYILYKTLSFLFPHYTVLN